VASILAAAKDERAVLMTSHDMVSAERLADRVGILEDGILMAVGTPAQLRSKYKPRDWSVRQHRATIGLEDLFLAMTGRGSVAL
jgi:ABC-2 type transport system ATP-binding protein